MVTNQQDLFQTIKDTLTGEFDLDPERITPDARLFEDLDLDSIDAVDMTLRLQELANIKVSPEDFQQVRTVGDIHRVVERLIAEQHPGSPSL